MTPTTTSGEGKKKQKTSEYCAVSKRIDGKKHSWKFDGDDPYIICVYCGETRDAISGIKIK